VSLHIYMNVTPRVDAALSSLSDDFLAHRLQSRSVDMVKIDSVLAIGAGLQTSSAKD
jgi:hypothetical protein